MKKRKRLVQDNKGMSLVEVLIAMIILSVTGVVFLRNFDYALAYNTKAKVKQDTMYLAQSVMESCKAYRIEDIDAQFAGAADDFVLFPTGTPSVIMNSGGTKLEYMLSGAEVGKSSYTVKLTAEPEVNHTKYITSSGFDNVFLIANPRSATDFVNVQAVTGIDDDGHSEKILTKVYDRMANDTEAEGLTSYLESGYPDYASLDSDFVKITKRISHIKIEAIDETKTSVSVSYEYFYHVNDFEYDYDGSDYVLPAYNDSLTIVDTSSSKEFIGGNRLQNVYFYYYPLYADSNKLLGEWLPGSGLTSTSINIYDQIVIETSEVHPVNVYLFKQEYPSVTSTLTNTFANYDQFYMPYITKTGTGLVEVYNNFGDNVYDGTAVNKVTETEGFVPESEFGSHFHSKMWAVDPIATSLQYKITVGVYNNTDLTNAIYTLSGSTNAK